MKTQAEIEAAFRKDFQELLALYNAEMEITYGDGGYSSNANVYIDIPSVFNDDGDVAEEYCSFVLL